MKMKKHGSATINTLISTLINNLTIALAVFNLNLSTALANTPTTTGQTTMTTKSGEVNFTAIGKPGFLKIRGSSKDTQPTGHIDFANQQVNGVFSFDLKGLDTGIELRNEHMKEKYLEISKHPTATLKLKPIPITAKDLQSDVKQKFTGELSLHGVTKEVSGDFEYKASDKMASAKFSIRVSDFQIDIPKYMGVTVSESVDLDVKLLLN